MSDIYIGLMSGTSLDGSDGVLVDFSGSKPRVLASATQVFPADFRAELLALNAPSDNELHRAALAANRLAEIYADVPPESVRPARCYDFGAEYWWYLQSKRFTRRWARFRI